MTVSALTRPGERDRATVKFSEIDWLFALVLCLIAGAGALMMFSIAGSSWEPWAGAHLTRFGLCFVLMVILAMVDLRVWSALAYPVYAVGLLLLVAVEVMMERRVVSCSPAWVSGLADGRAAKVFCRKAANSFFMASRPDWAAFSRAACT